MLLSRWPGDTVLEDNRPTRAWERWLSLLVVLFNKCPQQIGREDDVEQSAALTTAAIALPDPLPAGPYRVSYGLEVTEAAPTASSAQVTIGWTYNGQARTKTFPAFTANTTDTVDSNSIVIHTDEGSSITRAVAYASS